MEKEWSNVNLVRVRVVHVSWKATVAREGKEAPLLITWYNVSGDGLQR